MLQKEPDLLIMKGKLIVIDGVDGSGKATQRKLLQEALLSKKIKVESIEFPRYEDNIYGKLVGRYLKGEFGGTNDVSPYLTSLPYAGDRLLAKPLIEKWLDEGKIVITDRYVSASMGHQAAKLPVAERQEYLDWLEELEYQTNGLPREDLVLFLYVAPEMAQRNILQKDPRKYIEFQKRDIHEANEEFLSESTKMFLKLAKEKPDWVLVECMKEGKMKSRQDIHQEIVEVLEKTEII